MQGGYSFKLSKNGKVEYIDTEHPGHKIYTNVKVFATGKYGHPSDAWIRNLQVSTSRDSKVAPVPAPSVTVDIETVPMITTEIEEVPRITQTLIYGKGKKVKEDTLIGSFDKWWPTYEIRFEVKVDSFGSRVGLLLLFTDKNGDCRFTCNRGQYITAVFTSKRLTLRMPLISRFLFIDPDENKLSVKTYIRPTGTAPSGSIKGLKVGQWYEIVISQEKQLVKVN